jgi:hypothetical protein
MLPNPQPYFAHLPDSRRETKNELHKLGDIVMIKVDPLVKTTFSEK